MTCGIIYTHLWYASKSAMCCLPEHQESICGMHQRQPRVAYLSIKIADTTIAPPPTPIRSSSAYWALIICWSCLSPSERYLVKHYFVHTQYVLDFLSLSKYNAHTDAIFKKIKQLKVGDILILHELKFLFVGICRYSDIFITHLWSHILTPSQGFLCRHILHIWLGIYRGDIPQRPA